MKDKRFRNPRTFQFVVFERTSYAAAASLSRKMNMFFTDPMLLAASRCGTLCPDHHTRARERCGLHHALHGLFCGSSATQGWAHGGHVCLPGTLWPVSVGVHSWHRAPHWHPGVPAELAQPTPAPHGIHVLNNAVQLHVVRVWLLCTAR